MLWRGRLQPRLQACCQLPSRAAHKQQLACTLREGPEACEPGLRLGDKPPNPPRTQHLEPADPADTSGKPARDRLNDANLRVLKRNLSKPARAASCPWLQGCYSKRFQPYVGPPPKLHRQPAATTDACCVGGCAAPSQPACPRGTPKQLAAAHVLASSLLCRTGQPRWQC